MSTAPLPPIPADIAKITGPLFLGMVFNWGLFGALGVQAYIYYIAFPKDRALPKYLVVFACVIELLQTVLFTRDGFRIFGSEWGNLIELDSTAWLWFSTPVLTAITSCTVQLFFGWRIHVLSDGFLIPSIVAVLSFVQMVGGIWAGVGAHLIGQFSEVQLHNEKPTSVWLGGTALVDVIITISMIYFLYRSRTAFRGTNSLLTNLIRVTVETGLVCTTFAILDLVFFLRYKHNNYHLTPSSALSKLYTNSLLVVLNARVRIIGGRDTEQATADNSLSTSFVVTTPSIDETQNNHRLSGCKDSAGKRFDGVSHDSFSNIMEFPMVHVTTTTTVSS